MALTREGRNILRITWASFLLCSSHALLAAEGLAVDSVPLSVNSGRPVEPINRVLEAQRATGRGGVFQAEQSGEFVHVVPVQIRDSKGAWIPNGSVLDARITIADAPRTADAMLV